MLRVCLEKFGMNLELKGLFWRPDNLTYNNELSSVFKGSSSEKDVTRERSEIIVHFLMRVCKLLIVYKLLLFCY